MYESGDSVCPKKQKSFVLETTTFEGSKNPVKSASAKVEMKNVQK